MDDNGGALPTASDAAVTIDRPRAAVSRRSAVRLAGASAVVAVAGVALGARPAAAADPNDVVKNITNAVTATTSLIGSVSGELLELTNGSSSTGACALIGRSNVENTPAIRGDNLNSDGVGGIGILGWAPRGRDLVALGSGRIGLDSHSFDLTTSTYTVGELHQTAGTLYTMVSATVRRSLAGPDSAGAFYPIDPIRVYDSRRAAPNPGQLVSGGSRLVSVANGRSLSTGAVTQPNVVPVGATAVVFNLTVTGAVAGGFLAITPGGAATYNASMINFAAGQTIANASTVKLNANRQVKVFGSGGPVHFILDISGYYL